MPFVIVETAHGPKRYSRREWYRLQASWRESDEPPREFEEYHQARQIMTQREAWRWVRMKAGEGGR